MYWYYDPTYIFVIIGLLICSFASMLVKSTYNKYSRYRSMSGLTGAEAAQKILSLSGINDVRIERVSGDLTDHYDPSKKVLRLSDSVYGNSSVAAIGVAAHECGHAIQHNKSYVPLVLRSTIVPVASICSRFSIPIIIIGAIIGSINGLVTIGIAMFGIGLLFQVITLPVEFNASGRAIRVLNDNSLLSRDELSGAKKVLTAAALTYIAATIATLLQLIRYIMIFGNRRDD